jgi:LysM repeat protein
VTTPVPPPVVTPIIEPTATTATEHVIAKGETFGALATKYGVSVRAIQQANPGVDSTKLKVGQKINIPPKPPGGLAPSAGARATDVEVGLGETLYTVKKGDTLTKIAREHGVSIKAIRSANNLRTDQLRVGQKLKLPAKAAAAPSATAPAAPPPPSLPTAPASAPTVPPAP